MSKAERNKALYEEAMDRVWHQGDPGAIDEFYAQDVEIHNRMPGMPPGIDTVRAMVGMFRSGLSDMSFVADLVLAEGDQVAAHWTMEATHTGEFFGVPATGKKVSYHGMSAVRFEGGKVVEIWGASDQMGLMQQLGA